MDLKSLGESLLLHHECIKALKAYQAAWTYHDVAHFKSAAEHCRSTFHRRMIRARDQASEVLRKISNHYD